MNELITVNNDKQSVSARELYNKLEVTDRFSRWFERMIAYGFTENEDFTSVKTSTLVNNGAEREIQDYELSMDMAKHICMVQRNDKSKEVRQYLIDLEKAWNTPEQVMARALRLADKTIADLKNTIEHKEDVIIGLVDDVSLADKRQILNRVVRFGGENFQERWSVLYREFENKYHINLKVRMERYNANNSPKCRNRLDYVDRVMNKIPELYEIAAKIYENDVKALVDEMYGVIR
jgi:phage anti-repressor protein